MKAFAKYCGNIASSGSNYRDVLNRSPVAALYEGSVVFVSSFRDSAGEDSTAGIRQ